MAACKRIAPTLVLPWHDAAHLGTGRLPMRDAASMANMRAPGQPAFLDMRANSCVAGAARAAPRAASDGDAARAKRMRGPPQTLEEVKADVLRRTEGHWALACPDLLVPPKMPRNPKKKWQALQAHLASLSSADVKKLLADVPPNHLVVITRKGDNKQFLGVTPVCADRLKRKIGKLGATGGRKSGGDGTSGGDGYKGYGGSNYDYDNDNDDYDDDDDDDDDDGNDDYGDDKGYYDCENCSKDDESYVSMARSRASVQRAALLELDLHCQGAVRKRARKATMQRYGTNMHKLARKLARAPFRRVPEMVYVTSMLDHVDKVLRDISPLEAMEIAEEVREETNRKFLQRLEARAAQQVTDDQVIELPDAPGSACSSKECIYDPARGQNALGVLLTYMFMT